MLHTLVMARLCSDREGSDGAVAERRADQDVQHASFEQRRLARRPVLCDLLRR